MFVGLLVGCCTVVLVGIEHWAAHQAEVNVWQSCFCLLSAAMTGVCPSVLCLFKARSAFVAQLLQVEKPKDSHEALLQASQHDFLT